jgi:hypothetical protein
MLRRPAFWILFVLVSLASIGFAYYYFARAFPIVSLDISMNRAGAMAAARTIGDARHLGPDGYRAAASFSLDEETQTFVELEGGGKAAFARLLTGGLYSPYTWRVRHFKPGEKHETLIRFTPDGKPYGFVERLREDAPGAALAADEARGIAETTARTAWGVDLAAFALVEQSQERRPGGRVDHTFVYERPDVRLEQGRYRLRLTVSGDRLTEVTYFIQIPEAFSRRYEEMRSANDAIGVGSSIGMLLLYVVGGIGVGLFFLLRQRWVLWRHAAVWGFVIGFLQLAAGLNEWPLLWMQYDTALPIRTFVLQTVGLLVAGSLGLSVLLAGSFMAAESLTRRAFPSHPQLWRVWSREAASSPEILGRTVAGYLLVGVFFAYEVALYFLSTRVLGWWTPSEALVHPDVLATYQPWLSAIAPSAQAGFWEESLFRAVPLAGAALIGDRFGGRRWWIVAAMVVQAAIFGAGHAPYPTQPAYARAAELVLPSIGFGLLYLRFGLLPSIVLHYTFDVTWFALPVFVSTGATAHLSQLLIVLLTLVPLWVVLAGRLRTGRWQPLPEALRNGAWTPPPPAVSAPVVESTPPIESRRVWSPVLNGVLVAAGVAGLVCWAVARPFTSELPPLSVGRHVAAQAARDALAGRGVRLDSGWWVMPAVSTDRPGGRFVWETAGRDRYFALLGSYLSLPHWHVRVARFEGDVAERAEEWGVDVGADGAVENVSHTLPEATPGASLSEEDARVRARAVVEERFGLRGAQLENVSAESSKRPARMDWDITFADRSIPALPQGEPRITVSLLGDEVGDVRRFVHVPEEWTRRQRSEQTLSTVVQGATTMMIAGLVLTGAIGGIVSWSRRRFALRFFVLALAVFFTLSLAQAVNGAPAMAAMLSTAQPWKLQVVTLASLAVVGLVISSAVFALITGAAPRWPAAPPAAGRRRAAVVGVALGALAAGVLAAAAALRPTDGPAAGSYAAAANLLPGLALVAAPAASLVSRTALFLLVVGGVDRLTRGWTVKKVLGGLCLVAVGLLLGGGPPRDLTGWALSGLVAGALLFAAWLYVVRFDLSVVPPAMGTMLVLSLVREGMYQAYPGATLGATLGVVVTVAMTWWWFAELRRASS